MGALRGADLFSLAAGPPCRSGDNHAKTRLCAINKNRTRSHQIGTERRDESSPARLQIALQGNGNKLISLTVFMPGHDASALQTPLFPASQAPRREGMC